MADDREAIIKAYTDYFQAFQTMSPEAVVPYYHVPSLAIAPQGVAVMTTSDQVRALFDTMLTALQARGYARSEWADLHVKQLSDQTAVLSTRVLRYRTDGDELERFGATYALRKTDAGWKIVVITVHDPDTVLDVS